MNFLSRCNGYAFGRPTFSTETLKVFEAHLPAARKQFEAWMPTLEAHRMGSYYLGHRYSDNKSVLERITSAADEQEFLADPAAWCLDALRDCASADHWYAFEKQWD